jgi:hypothetical protein
MGKFVQERSTKKLREDWAFVISVLKAATLRQDFEIFPSLPEISRSKKLVSSTIRFVCEIALD